MLDPVVQVQGGKVCWVSPNDIPFVAAMQTTVSDQPITMCLSQQPLTYESIQDSAEKPLVEPSILVSGGPGYGSAVHRTGFLHESHVAGGGVTSARRQSFLAANMAVGIIKTSLAATYDAFGFKKYAHHCLDQVRHLSKCRFCLSAINRRLARAATRTTPCPLRAPRAAGSAC